MTQPDFMARLASHIDHIRRAGPHCGTEETTKQALILPMLDLLGFSPYDPTKVRAEFGSDFPGAKSGERVDYALFLNGAPVMFIEAKPFGAALHKHSPQLGRYFNATANVKLAAVTNGQEWRFFTDLSNANMMDQEPFLIIDLLGKDQADFPRLMKFRHDEFEGDALRNLAEESTFLLVFRDAISSSLRDCDADFVRYVASRAKVQRQFTAKFIESITPIVKASVQRSVSEMVVSGLSAPVSMPPSPPAPAAASPAQPAPAASIEDDQIDLSNPKIVTTAVERRILAVTQDILAGYDVVGKDTESYYSALYQGKNNRWLLRYHGARKQPSITLPITLSEAQKAQLHRLGMETTGDFIRLDNPDHLYKISGLILDCLDWAMNDDHFRKARVDAGEA